MSKREITKWSLIGILFSFVLILPFQVSAQWEDHVHGDDLIYPLSGAQVTSAVVMEDVVLPGTTAKKDAAMTDKPRVIAGYARYEMVSDDKLDIDADLYGVTLGMAWDVDNFSYGFIIPYDRGSIDDSTNRSNEDTDLNRYGTVGFFQYNKKMAENWNAGLTGNVNAFWSHSETAGDSDTVRVLGAGASVAFGYDNGGVFVPSFALSYQYNQDDTDNQYNYQHLFKTGVDAGFRMGEAAVVSAFCIWNIDISDHMKNVDGNNFGDVGVEARFNMTDSFVLNGGYKTVLNLEDYSSHTIYLGALYRF